MNAARRVMCNPEDELGKLLTVAHDQVLRDVSRQVQADRK